MFEKIIFIWMLLCPSVYAQVMTAEAAKIQCGYELFFDRALSIRGTTSCADCHDPKLGWTDGRKIAVGLIGDPNSPQGLVGIRNTPTIMNIREKAGKDVFLDGRTPGLVQQALLPTLNNIEMGHPNIQSTLNSVRRKPRYGQLMAMAFGTPDITRRRAEECIVAFEKTINFDDLPADRLAAGIDSGLPTSAVKGFKVFMDNCSVCHIPNKGWRDYKFHNTGIAARAQNNDIGLGKTTNNVADNFKFATQTLRGINLTAPYMHDGSIKTIKEAVGFYAKGGRFLLNGQVQQDVNLDPLVAKINLNEDDSQDLDSFMELGFQKPNPPFLKNPHNPGVAAK